MICGLINHAVNEKELHLLPENFEHDSSLTISIVHSHLMSAMKLHKTRPEKIQFQLDNCYKDNKNIYSFGYCAVSVMPTSAQTRH